MCKNKDIQEIDHLHFSPETRAAAAAIHPGSRQLQSLLLQRAALEGMDYALRLFEPLLEPKGFNMARAGLMARRQVLSTQAIMAMEEQLGTLEDLPF